MCGGLWNPGASYGQTGSNLLLSQVLHAKNSSREKQVLSSNDSLCNLWPLSEICIPLNRSKTPFYVFGGSSVVKIRGREGGGNYTSWAIGALTMNSPISAVFKNYFKTIWACVINIHSAGRYKTWNNVKKWTCLKSFLFRLRKNNVDTKNSNLFIGQLYIFYVFLFVLFFKNWMGQLKHEYD